jgi:hypothetical protein
MLLLLLNEFDKVLALRLCGVNQKYIVSTRIENNSNVFYGYQNHHYTIVNNINSYHETKCIK